MVAWSYEGVVRELSSYFGYRYWFPAVQRLDSKARLESEDLGGEVTGEKT